MRLSDFILLDNGQKQSALLQQGALLAKREDDTCKVFLFQLDDYYVETFCNTQSKVIEEYRVFGDSPLLQAYLQAIPLDDLLN